MPHERLDNFDKAVRRLSDLASHFDDQECAGNRDCDLKFYHKARASLRADTSIQDIFVPDKYPVKAAGLMSRTRASQRLEETGHSSSGEECVIDSQAPDSVILNCDKQLKFFCSELVNDLSNKVVSERERELIDKTRDIVDTSKMIGEIKQLKMSPDIYAESSFPRFKEAVDYLKIPGLDFIEDSVIKMQYKRFIQIISSLNSSASSEECVIEMDPKQVIMRLFNSTEKLYEDIQIINHTIAVAATKSTTESIIESFVSEYEYTSHSRANYTEKGISDTFEIQKDGPLVSKSDNLVKTVLDKYFSDRKTNGWHFVTRKNENLMRTSKTLLKIDEKKSKLPFME